MQARLLPEDSGREAAEQYREHRAERASPFPAAVANILPAGEYLPARGGLLRTDPRLNGRGNLPVRIAMMQQAQHSYGNRALQRFLQGHAILPIQRQEAGSEDCKKLITDKDWTVKGPKNGVSSSSATRSRGAATARTRITCRSYAKAITLLSSR